LGFRLFDAENLPRIIADGRGNRVAKVRWVEESLGEGLKILNGRILAYLPTVQFLNRALEIDGMIETLLQRMLQPVAKTERVGLRGRAVLLYSPPVRIILMSDSASSMRSCRRLSPSPLVSVD